MTARIIPTPPFDLTVVGATGDLTRRKLLPALYQRDRAGQLPEAARLLGAARSDMDADGWRRWAQDALEEFVPAAEREAEPMRRFLRRLDYAQVDLADGTGWSDVASALRTPGGEARAVYLAIAPGFYGAAAQQAAEAGVLDDRARLVVEKPFGTDLATARALNAQLLSRIDEGRLYRIDHYLGKETVQNLMAIRFANALFEPLWNARHIDHVQITVAESVGVEGRGGYYDRSGAMRDMVQNHLLQLLCLVAMEPPYRFEADAVRDEKLKVLRALRPLDARGESARGQYAGGPAGAGYLADAGLDASRTPTFVALRASIDNWRWSGTPFYLRTGKRLRARLSEIIVQFREPPHSVFPAAVGDTRPDALRIRLQPDEGISFEMTVKDPGPGGLRLAPATLDMTFAERLQAQGLRMPDAYERLLLDVIRGDQTLFMRGDEVEAAWAWVDPILAAWEDTSAPEPYDIGSSGPEGALSLMHRDGRRWREIAA
ncbi:MAG: glucose-6-phosphate dehydrogenase [Pseudomonadota bacterium]